MMPNVFISYSTHDEHIAKQIHQALTSVNVDTFLAGISIEPGSNWTKTVFDALRDSEWVFFIASKSACASHAVQQELGASLVQNKSIIPILIDISPSELPGWVGQHQAIDARKDSDHLNQTIQAIGEKVKNQKFWAGVVLTGVALALITSQGR